MSLIRLLTAAAVVLAPGVAMGAETVLQENNLSGQMASVCRLGTMVSTSAENAAFQPSITGGLLQITNLASSQTALVQSATMALTLDGMCNQPHTLKIRSSNGGLTTDAGPTGGFINRIDYSARVTWGGQTGILQPQGQVGANLALTVPTAAGSGLGVEIQIIPASLPAVAGQYEDSLVIELLGGL